MSEDIPILPNNAILLKSWRIVSNIGCGACGRIYEVLPEGNSLRQLISASSSSSSSSASSSVSLNSSKNASNTSNSSIKYVAKCIPNGMGLTGKKKKDQERISNTLFKEMNLLAPGKHLTEFKYRPRLPPLQYYGVDMTHGVTVLVMEKLDTDLIAYAKQRPKPSVQDIARIGLQMVEGLEWLHSKGWLFIDIKPDNFMFRGEQIVFIDYGLAESFGGFGLVGGAEPPPGGFNGTPTFASLDVYLGAAPGRKDEIEAMALVLLSLCTDGLLPWSSATSQAQLQQLKKTYDLHRFAREHHCEELWRIIELSRRVDRKDAPDYAGARELLTQLQQSTYRPAAASASATVATAATKAASARGGRKLKPAAVEVIDVDESFPAAAAGAQAVDLHEESSSSRIPSRKAKKSSVPSASVVTASMDSEVVESSKRKADTSAAIATPATTRRLRPRSEPSVNSSALVFTVTSGNHRGLTHREVFPGLQSPKSRVSADGYSRIVIGTDRKCDFVLAGSKGESEIADKHCTLLWKWAENGDVSELNLQNSGVAARTVVNKQNLTDKKWVSINLGQLFEIGANTVIRVDLVRDIE